MKIERIDISAATPDPANVRRHDEKNLAAIKGSLVKFGQQTPIVLDRRGIVLKGNGTLAAAKALGWETIDVVYTDLSGTDAVGYAIADNRTGELAAWDDAGLGKTLEALKADGFALDMIGFDDRDLERWLDAPAAPVIEPEPREDSDEDDEPEAAPIPAVVPKRAAVGQVWQLGRHRLVCGNSGDQEVVARLIAGETGHALVSDPPYGLSFMGKAWDKAVPQTPLWKVWVDVLRPGAHILMFSGTRTYHRATCALEDAGVDVRDQIQWLHGQGFPKSHDVSKAIDKAAGAEREVIATRTDGVGNVENSAHKLEGFGRGREATFDVTAPATDAAAEWEGFGTALKPANEPICLARKPFDGTVAECVQKHGTGALNIDGARVGGVDTRRVTGGSPDRGKWRTSAGAIAGSELGRFPANVVLSHTPDCVQTGTRKVQTGTAVRHNSGGKNCHSDAAKPPLPDAGFADADGAETVEAWDCAPGVCPVRMLDEQSGPCSVNKPAIWRSDSDKGWQQESGHNSHIGHREKGQVRTGFGDTGGASRFFYVAKPARSERGEGNSHATVKPLRLMEYLVKLVTADSQTVLEPFCGSGTTLLACERTGRTCFAAELDPGHCDIVLARWEALTGKTAVLA